MLVLTGMVMDANDVETVTDMGVGNVEDNIVVRREIGQVGRPFGYVWCVRMSGLRERVKSEWNSPQTTRYTYPGSARIVEFAPRTSRGCVISYLKIAPESACVFFSPFSSLRICRKAVDNPIGKDWSGCAGGNECSCRKMIGLTRTESTQNSFFSLTWAVSRTVGCIEGRKRSPRTVLVGKVEGKESARTRLDKKINNNNNRNFYSTNDTYPTMSAALESNDDGLLESCLLYTSPSPRDRQKSRMPSSA